MATLVLRLAGRLPAQRSRLGVLLILTLSAVALESIGPRILARATDLVFGGQPGQRLPGYLNTSPAVEAPGVDLGAVGRTLLLALCVYLCAALMIWAQARLLATIVRQAVTALRAELQSSLGRLPLSYFDTHQRGELLSRATYDVNNVEIALRTALRELPTGLLTLGAVFAMMVAISPLLAVVTVLTVPIAVLLTRLIVRRANALMVSHAQNVGALNAYIDDVYSGIDVVQVYDQGTRILRQFGERNEEVRRDGFRVQAVAGLSVPVTTMLANLGYVAVALVGGLQMTVGAISLGGVQAFIQYVRQFNQPINQAAAMSNRLLTGNASAHRILELLEAAHANTTTPTGFDLIDGQSDEIAVGRIEFDHVTFGYGSDVPVFDGLNLSIQPGKTIAIVGPTGSGKTTLVDLVMRFHEPTSGRILIDGRDIATFDPVVLRSQIGMVLQDPWLIAGSIADNISYGRPNAGRESIIAAATIAGASEFIPNLPDGYDEWVDEENANLSLGQLQLITIARAVLTDPKILILDEATSAVDGLTDLRVQHAVSELCRDRTCLLISHRLSSIRGANEIVTIDGGRIVERGTHAELIAARGVYYAMTQAAQISDGD